jgi:hypothetical protein
LNGVFEKMGMLLEEASSSLRSAINDAATAMQSEQVTKVCPYPQDWALNCCCTSVQIQIIAATCVYSVLIFFLWDFQILLPFKLVVVFLHELSHALATWATCGKVISMEVHGNEGGLTKTVGGSRFIILSSGYLGSALWGMVCVIASADYVGVQVMAALLGYDSLVPFCMRTCDLYSRILGLHGFDRLQRITLFGAAFQHI